MEKPNVLLAGAVLAVMSAAAVPAAGLAGAATSRPADETFAIVPVGKRVSDFPAKEDLATPASAYAAVNRVLVAGKADGWRRVHARRLRAGWKRKKDTPPLSPERAKGWLQAQILEVLVFRGETAMVVARLAVPASEREVIDGRMLAHEEGQWRNTGHSLYPSREAARHMFARVCSGKLGLGARKPVADPKAYLRPFVRHLRTHGREPKAFLLEAVEKHSLVMMGEIHHRPAYWALAADVIGDPRFAKAAGCVYLELPHHAQGLVDRFLAADKLDTGLVIEVLRDNLWMGWPDQPMLEFFVAVWRANRRLEKNRRIRIVLVDMARPWRKIRQRGDWAKYRCDRDELMARLVLKDRVETPDKRHGLFIVGLGHAATNLKLAVGGYALKTAGWHLRRKLGGELYTIVQHGAMMTNWGRVDGRACLGLFDSAFAELGYRTIAFPLADSPFGTERFSAMPDVPSEGTYGDAFDAYLFLKKLEEEKFSSLIDGFYTDEFVKELDRRYRMMYGRGLVRGCRLARLDAESFIGWMSRSWGRPRRQWQAQSLGPLDAWHHGGRNWREAVRARHHRQALADPSILTEIARAAFRKLQTENYRKYLLDAALGWPAGTWKQFGPPYRVREDYPAWTRWVCRTFRADPIVTVELGKPFRNQQGLPTIPYKLTLKSGAVLRGDLPLEYQPRTKQWMGIEGLDWHLKYPKGPPAAGAKTRGIPAP